MTSQRLKLWAGSIKMYTVQLDGQRGEAEHNLPWISSSTEPPRVIVKIMKKKKSDLKLHAQRWRHVWPIPQSTTRGQITIRCEGSVCGLYRADSMFSFTRPWGVGQDSYELFTFGNIGHKYAVTGMGCRQRGLYTPVVSLCMGVCMCFSAIDTEQEW